MTRFVKLHRVAWPVCAALALSAWAQERAEPERRAVVNVMALPEAAAPGAPPGLPAPLPTPAIIAAPRLKSTAGLPRLEAAAQPPAAASVPPMLGGFPALVDDLRRMPPDSDGAVGPNHVVSMLNSQVQFQDRAGSVLKQVTLDAFWSGVGPFSATVFDPRLAFDAGAGRWIATALADSRLPTSALLVGASQTSDPTGQWSLYRISVGNGSAWGDYDVMGFNAQWVVVSVNSFSIPLPGDSSGGAYQRTSLYVFGKTDLYGGAKAPYTLLPAGDGTGSFVPVTDPDNVSDGMYLAQSLFTKDGTGALRISMVQGAVGSESLLIGAGAMILLFPDTWARSAPGGADFAPQAGTSANIDTGDSRMQSCMLRKGSIWCAHTVFLPANPAPLRASIEWYQVDAASFQPLQRGRIDDPTGQRFYAYPSLAVNRNGDLLIGYTRFSTADYPSAAYSFRAAGDPPNTLQPEVVFKPGEAPFARKSGADNTRWGDYSSTVVDPADGLTLWTIQEYAASPTLGYDRWGTWWAQVQPRPSGAAACSYALVPATAQFDSAGSTASIQVSTTAGCLWTAAVNVPWILLVSGAPATGSGAVALVVLPNGVTSARTGTVTIAGQTLSVTQAGAAAPKPEVPATGITNAASFASGPVAPGELVTMFGSDMGPADLATLRLNSAGLVDTLLAGTRVLFDGVAAPMIYTSAGQVSAIVPFGVGRPWTQVQVEFLGVASDAVTLPVADSAPGLFTANASGAGQGAILNQDFSVNSAAHAAPAGSVVMLFATGAGLMDAVVPDGQPAAVPLANVRLPMSATIGGRPAKVTYQGGAPGLVAGVVQINVEIPSGLAPGDQPVRILVGATPTPPGVTVAVK